MRRKKWNKKGGLGIVVITVITMIGWFFLWIGVDYATSLGDGIVNRTVERNNEIIPANWSANFGAFQQTRTNMNRIIMLMGLIIIPIAGIGASLNQKVQGLRAR